MDDLMDDLTELLGVLGFNVAATGVANSLPSERLRKALEDRYYDAIVSQYILSFPPLFAMHETTTSGVFFVARDTDERKGHQSEFMLERYIPKDILLVDAASTDDGSTAWKARWFNEDESRMRALSEAISDRFGFTASDEQRARLQGRGWLV